MIAHYSKVIFAAQRPDRRTAKFSNYGMFKEVAPGKNIKLPKTAMQIDKAINEFSASSKRQSTRIFVRRNDKIDVSDGARTVVWIILCRCPAFY